MVCVFSQGRQSPLWHCEVLWWGSSAVTGIEDWLTGEGCSTSRSTSLKLCDQQFWPCDRDVHWAGFVPNNQRHHYLNQFNILVWASMTARMIVIMYSTVLCASLITSFQPPLGVDVWNPCFDPIYHSSLKLGAEQDTENKDIPSVEQNSSHLQVLEHVETGSRQDTLFTFSNLKWVWKEGVGLLITLENTSKSM